MRKFILFYIALMLSLTPLASHASSKKSHKHTAKSQSNQYQQVKFDSSSIRGGSNRVHHRLRSQKSCSSFAWEGLEKSRPFPIFRLIGPFLLILSIMIRL